MFDEVESGQAFITSGSTCEGRKKTKEGADSFKVLQAFVANIVLLFQRVQTLFMDYSTIQNIQGDITILSFKMTRLC